MKSRDLTGLKINNLTGIKRVENYVNKKGIKAVQWLFRCDCGNEKVIQSNWVVSGAIEHCGCKPWKSRNRQFDPKESSFRAKASTVKGSAKSRGIVWDLSLEYASELLKLNCFYCYSPPSQPFNSMNNRKKEEKNKRKVSNQLVIDSEILTNGIDRLDSSKGYVKNNVVPCCKICNFAKNELTLKEFYDWVQKIHKNFKYENCSNQ